MNTPPAEGHEQALAEALVGLADTLVDQFDVIELLHRLCAECVALLDTAAAGLLLTDQRGGLRTVAASDEQAHLVELFQLQADQGPCLDCFRTAEPVRAPDLATETRWPRFSARAREEGFAAVHALPLRLRGKSIGALNLFHHQAQPMPAATLRTGQALADMATIAILSDRHARERDLLTEQLQAALTSRVIIEQAKGVLSARGAVDMAEAFTRMRNYARSHGQRLADVARGVIENTLDTDPLLPPTTR